MVRICECGCGKEIVWSGGRFIRGHYSRSKEFKERCKQTCLKNHGVENPFQSEKIKEKIKKTNLKNLGVENPAQSEEIKEKSKQTCLKNFGVEYSMQSEEVKEKSKQTCIKHFGVDHQLKSEEIKEKSRLTTRHRFGTDYVFQSEEVKSKIKKSYKQRFNLENPSQSNEIKEKKKNTSLINYGVDNYSKTAEFRAFARGQMIDAITKGLKDGEKFTPRKGNNELDFINELRKHTFYFIDNDAKILNYFPDGYIKELNLVIELDESHHNFTCYKIRDDQKDIDYKNIGLNIFRVDEKNWLENKDHVINEFNKLVE